MSVEKTISDLQAGMGGHSPAINDEILGKIKQQQSALGEAAVAPQKIQGVDRIQAFRPVARPSSIRTSVKIY